MHSCAHDLNPMRAFVRARPRRTTLNHPEPPRTTLNHPEPPCIRTPGATPGSLTLGATHGGGRGDYYSCAEKNCITSCAFSPGGRACRDCTKKYCLAGARSCTGIPAEYFPEPGAAAGPAPGGTAQQMGGLSRGGGGGVGGVDDPAHPPPEGAVAQSSGERMSGEDRRVVI